MVIHNDSTINFDARVHLENRGDRWAAYIEPPGTFVYGATEQAVLARVDVALGFFVQHFSDSPDGVRKLRHYLDSHGVPNFVTEHSATRPIRLRRPVRLPMEAAASV